MKAFLKYQEGGDLSSFLVDFEPYMGNGRQQAATRSSSSSGSSSSESSNKKNDVGIEDLFKLVSSIKGLPSEIQAVSNKLAKIYDDAVIFNNGVINTSDLVSTYFSILGDLGKIQYNQKQYDLAVKVAETNEGINDIAVDSRGRVFVQNLSNGQITPVTLEQYKQIANSDNYEALTNSHLLRLAANDPHFAFNNGELLGVVMGSMGIKKVNELILQVADKIGTSKLQSEGYSKRKAEQIVAGFDQLTAAQQKGMSVDGLYKQQLITSNQLNEAKAALSYIWTTLPVSAKNRLRVAAAQAGMQNIEQGAYELVGTLIQSGLNSEYISTLNLTSDPNEKTTRSNNSGSSGSGGDNETDYGGNSDKTDPYTNMIKMMGGTEIPLVIQKGNVVMSFTGKNYSELVDINGKPIEETSVADLLTRGLGTIVTDKNAIVFGNQVVTTEQLSNIMYDNSGGTMIIFPCKKDANGRTIINTDILDEYESAMKELSEISNPTEQQEAEIYTKHGLMNLVDQKTGLPDRSKFAQFLVIDGYAVNKDNFLKPSSFLRELHNPSDQTIKRITKALSQGDKKEDKYDWDPDDKWALEWGSDEIYKGVLYIPITNNELQSKTAFQKTVKEPYSYEGDYQLMLKRIGAQSADGDILGINPGKISSN